MATLTIRMDDNDAELVRNLAAFEGRTISDFARAALLERVEDYYDPVSYTHLTLPTTPYG